MTVRPEAPIALAWSCCSYILRILVVTTWMLPFQPLTFQAFISAMGRRRKSCGEVLELVLGEENFPRKYSAYMSFIRDVSQGHS